MLKMRLFYEKIVKKPEGSPPDPLLSMAGCFAPRTTASELFELGLCQMIPI